MHFIQAAFGEESDLPEGLDWDGIERASDIEGHHVDRGGGTITPFRQSAEVLDKRAQGVIDLLIREHARHSQHPRLPSKLVTQRLHRATTIVGLGFRVQGFRF